MIAYWIQHFSIEQFFPVLSIIDTNVGFDIVLIIA